MKQPYSCWLEVPEGARWDKKKSSKPNLHVCGEDDIKRAEALRKGDWNMNQQKILRGKPYDSKNWTCLKKKVDRYICANLSLNVRLNRFSFRVNLVLGYPRSTNLLFGPLMFEFNTSFGSLQIEFLQLYYIILTHIPSSMSIKKLFWYSI